MNMFIEKIVFPLIVILLGILIYYNPMKFDWTQRITLSLAILLICYFITHTLEKKNKSQPSTIASQSVLEETSAQKDEKNKASLADICEKILINNGNTPLTLDDIDKIINDPDQRHSKASIEYVLKNDPRFTQDKSRKRYVYRLKAKESPIDGEASVDLQWPGFQEKYETITFTFGGMTMRVSSEALQRDNPPKFMRFNDYEPFTVRIVDNQLHFSFKVWNSNNLPPVEITNNEFKVRPPNWDRNSNINAFEVINSDGYPVFQMIRNNPAHITVTGIFPTPVGIFLAKPGTTIGPVNSVPNDFRLDTIFRYPSWKYPGQYVD